MAARPSSRHTVGSNEGAEVFGATNGNAVALCHQVFGNRDVWLHVTVCAEQCDYNAQSI